MKNFVLASLTAAVAMIAAPGIVEAKDTAGTTFRIRARVPVACWVRPDTTVIAQNGASGTVTEACNSPGGYVVQAHYRPLANGESAQIIYGDTSLNLSPSGGHELRRSHMATIRNVTYRFDSVEVTEPLTLHLTIQPI